MVDIKELRDDKARLLTAAQSILGEITDKTDEARATEINAQFDKIMDDAAAKQAEIDRRERLATAMASLDAGDPRVPTLSADEGRAVDQPRDVTYRAAFHSWLRSGGDVHGLTGEERSALARGVRQIEGRAQTSAAAAGGNLIPDEAMQPLVAAMILNGPMLDENVVTVIRTAGGGEIPIPTVNDTASTAEDSTEGAEPTNDGGKDIVFGKVVLNDYMSDTEWLVLSPQLVSGAYANVEAIIGGLLGERLGRKANQSLTTGSGSQAPQGVVTGSTLGKTAAATAAITANEVRDLIMSVNAVYRNRPKSIAMMNDATYGYLGKLTDGDGTYLLKLMPDGSERIVIGNLAVKYRINPAMANITAGAKPIIYGDMSKYFVRQVGETVIGVAREKYWPNHGMAGYNRIDGVVADTTAIKHLALAAAG